MKGSCYIQESCYLQDVSDLFGADLPVEGEEGGVFAWRDGPLLQALKSGSWVVLDEVCIVQLGALKRGIYIQSSLTYPDTSVPRLTVRITEFLLRNGDWFPNMCRDK